MYVSTACQQKQSHVSTTQDVACASAASAAFPAELEPKQSAIAMLSSSLSSMARLG